MTVTAKTVWKTNSWKRTWNESLRIIQSHVENKDDTKGRSDNLRRNSTTDKRRLLEES
jgi:hypothetical protein